MSGFNAFVLTNMLRRSIGKTDILEDDPIAIDPPARPQFYTLEFLVGPPKKLKVTISSPTDLVEPTWLRVFCRGHRMAHLIMAKVVQAAEGVPIPWDVTYPCDVEPDAAAPPWTRIGDDFCTAAAGIITIDTVTPGGISVCAYRLASIGFDNAVGWVAEFKMKVVESAGLDARLLFEVIDDKYFERLYISDSRIELAFDGGGCDMDTTDDYHVYRITVHGKDICVYVDSVLRIEGTLSEVAAANRMIFGDYATPGGQNSKSMWDYIRWYLSGYTPPDRESHEWENMRYAKGAEFSLQNDLYDVQLDLIGASGRYSAPSGIKRSAVHDSFPGGLWGSYWWDTYVWG